LLRELGAEAEIGDLDGAAGGEEDVVGFDVAVDNVLVVEVDEAFAGLRGEFWLAHNLFRVVSFAL